MYFMRNILLEDSAFRRYSKILSGRNIKCSHIGHFSLPPNHQILEQYVFPVPCAVKTVNKPTKSLDNYWYFGSYRGDSQNVGS